MVDEILRGFLDPLFARYREIVAEQQPPRATLEAVVAASFRAIDEQHARSRSTRPRRGIWPINRASPTSATLLTEFRALWHDVLRAGVADGSFRADLDVEMAYRFLRDTVWVAVSWYRPGGKLEHRRRSRSSTCRSCWTASRRADRRRQQGISVDGRGLSRRRRPHAGRPPPRRTVGGASGGPRCARDHRAVRPQPDRRPGRRRRRDLRLHRHARPAGRRHRAHVLAGRRLRRSRSRRDDRPAVRLEPAGRPLRGAGGDERNGGPGRRRRACRT